jgi:hypothetical protein
MLLIEVDEGADTICLDDLSDGEVSRMYAEAVDDYCDAVEECSEGYGDYQELCAEAVVLVADEVKRRGLFLRTLH